VWEWSTCVLMVAWQTAARSGCAAGLPERCALPVFPPRVTGTHILNLLGLPEASSTDTTLLYTRS
jgi:hypothetical protein